MSDSDSPPPRKPDAASPDGASPDVVLLHSPTDDGKGVRVLRAREGRVEAGEIRPVESGRPLQGDIVKLRPRKEAPLVCDVEVTYAHQPRLPHEANTTKRHPGPANVATPAYRDSWERIFGGNESALPPSPKDDLN